MRVMRVLFFTIKTARAVTKCVCVNTYLKSPAFIWGTFTCVIWECDLVVCKITWDALSTESLPNSDDNICDKGTKISFVRSLLITTMAIILIDLLIYDLLID